MTPTEWALTGLIGLFGWAAITWLGAEIIILRNEIRKDFPFTRITEATNDELGLDNRDTLVELDNTIYWVGKDRNGAREVYRAVGYNPQQISAPTIGNKDRRGPLA